MGDVRLRCSCGHLRNQPPDREAVPAEFLDGVGGEHRGDDLADGRGCVHRQCPRFAVRGVAPVHADAGFAEDAFGGEEGLLRLLADAEAGQIERLLVYKYDRLGRNLAETSAIIAQLEDSGVEVVSVTEGKDTLARGVQLVVAEHYSRALAERTRDGLMQRFKQRASTGGPPPYGYEVVEENGTKRRRINEPEAAVVRAIFGDYLSGKGFKEIAHDLYRRGVPTRRGGPWTFASVRVLGDSAKGQFDYSQLARILMSPDAETPGELLDALYFVDNLSDPDCYDRILQECQEAGIDLGGNDLSPEDLAIRAWLADRNILERVHAEQYRARPQRFESFFAGLADRPDLTYPTDTVLAALEGDLNEWFDFKQKGRGARVFVFARADGVWFLVRHGQRIKREGTVEADESSGSVFYRPEKFDVLIYYPDKGELAINTETKGERRAYCRYLGKHLFGDTEFFRFDDPISKYTLTPLITMGREALRCGDVQGLGLVLLQELHIAHNSDQDDIEVRKASEDVFRALENQNRSLQNEEAAITLVKAKFRVTFLDLMGTLVQRGDIETITVPTAGRSGVKYRLRTAPMVKEGVAE
jgi:DNA invertase Pin-like site-specific DNA recombinase